MDTSIIEAELLEDLHSAVAKCEGKLNLIAIVGTIECMKHYVLESAADQYKSSQRRQNNCFAPAENN